jgi:tRNA G46 methylase TrmB
MKKIYFLFVLFISNIGVIMANAETTQKFDWDELIVTPVADEQWLKGGQVLNFYPCDKDYRNSPAAVDTVKKYFQDAKPISTDAGLLKYGSDQVSLDGIYVEMGVCNGRTINFIAALNPEKIIYGFDSFEGLPEAWVREDIYIPNGKSQ